MTITLPTPDGRSVRVTGRDGRWVVLSSDGGSGMNGDLAAALREALGLGEDAADLAGGWATWLDDSVERLVAELEMEPASERETTATED